MFWQSDRPHRKEQTWPWVTSYPCLIYSVYLDPLSSQHSLICCTYMQEHRPFPFKKLSFVDSTTILTKHQTICRYWFMVELIYPVYFAAARPLCLASDWQSISVMSRRSFVCGVDAFHPVSIAIWWVNKSLLKNIKTLDSPAGLWWISQEVCYAPLHISHPLCSMPLFCLSKDSYLHICYESFKGFLQWIFIIFGETISN